MEHISAILTFPPGALLPPTHGARTQSIAGSRYQRLGRWFSHTDEASRPCVGHGEKSGSIILHADPTPAYVRLC